tara:strand:- start:573 stop:2177 length:1605 start_codon:yes stop_codon:yes gene_type:complete
MSQPYGLACTGGLHTSLNEIEALKQPGVATKLINFEVDTDGGYRRISGYNLFGSARPNGSNKILGLQVYADGVIACSGTNIYFSQDGNSWLQINRASVAGSGDNHTAFTGRSTLARTNQGQVTFTVFESTFDYGLVLICDGANKPFFFRMEGTGANLNSRTFFAGEVTVSSTKAPSVGVIHDGHFVVSGADTADNTIYYSGTNDPTDFTSTGSGNITLTDKVVGLSSFRSDLIIFCQNSIFKLININDSTNIAVVPITENVGCMDRHTIQEIGGDLVFLSPDGLRTVAGTARIGDTELGVISSPIESIVKGIAPNINNFTLCTAILRNKSQYRLFYNTDGTADATAKGIIATLTREGFQYSETEGIKATAITSDFDKDGVEQTYHGDGSGYVYNHDVANVTSFFPGGTIGNIRAVYKTPNLDFGDFGTNKTLRYVKLSISPEGTISPTLRVRYDYESSTVSQPLDYILDSIPPPSIFASAIFNSNVFGATPDPLVRQAVQGSGNTTSFIITSDDRKSPFTVNGLYIDYSPTGRR